jgi:hypothetical protein
MYALNCLTFDEAKLRLMIYTTLIGHNICIFIRAFRLQWLREAPEEDDEEEEDEEE